MGRDDWKHFEEFEDEEEEGTAAPAETLCRKCLHTVPAEAPYCPWCGKPLPEPAKPPTKKD